MKRVVLFTVVTTVFLGSLASGQDPQPSAYEHLKDLECFLGTWESKTTIPESSTDSERLTEWAGKSLHLRMNVKWAPGKSAQVWVREFKIPGEVKITETVLQGWDQSSKKVKSYSFTTHEGVWAGTCKKAGEAWVMEYTGVNLDGNKCTGTTTIKFEGKDAFVAKDTDQTVDGKPFPDTESRFTRVGKKQQPSDSERVDATTVDAAREWLKYLSGDWTREVEWQTEEGDVRLRKGRDTAELHSDGLAVVVKNVGEDGSTDVCMLGWEPRRKAIVETGFNSAGFAWTITFDSIKKGEISGKNLVTAPDGSKFAGRALLRRKGDKQYDVEMELKTPTGNTIQAKGTVIRTDSK